jgi:phosphoribosylformylglycinamidine synthase I
MQSAVITFPGSNCDHDMYVALKTTYSKEPIRIWHADTSLPKGVDLIAIPGGFSYGDYLRSGAISARSPIMQEVVKAAKNGTYILGVCNGFQILTEAGLLPGTLLRNRDLRFICKTVTIKIANSDAGYTKAYKAEEVLNIPIAHHDGNYFASIDVLKEIEDNGRIAFKYCDKDGNVNNVSNPNGSLQNIAGIFSENKRVLGMMPHPERAVDALTGGIDGKKLFEGLAEV